MAASTTICFMRNALFGLVVAVAVSIGTGLAAALLVIIGVTLGAAPQQRAGLWVLSV